ncbi:hypothetical protein C8R43DRAFT_885996 [Mycena crocata]|nr:hypothetical protein C8R43DRAFT_885996 [Mycena crocata]
MRTLRRVEEGSSYDTPASKRYKKSNLNPNQDASLNNLWWETRNQFSSVAIPASSPRRPATPPNNWETANELVNLVEANVTKNPIGIIYLSASPFSTSPHLGELNLGIILDAKYRSKGYAREALQLVMKHAFDDKHCHRIQASLLNLSAKDRLISLLTQQRFGHEGTKRRSFFNPLMGEWQDVTTLAILDTDWAMRTLYKPAPKSLWDELFLRHERERDELLRWEESQNRLKRTASMETIRAITIDTDASNESDAATSTSSSFRSSTSKGKGKGKQTIPNLERRGSHDGFNSDADSESGFNNNPFSSNPFLPKYGILDDGTMQYTSGRSSPTLSDVSSLESVPRSVTPGSVASATSESDWDMFESSSSSSNFDDSE